MKFEVFHCDQYTANLSIRVCRERRDALTMSKLKCLFDPFDRCRGCKQASNVDKGEIELFFIDYNAAGITEHDITVSSPQFTKGKKRKPLRLLHSSKNKLNEKIEKMKEVQ